MRFIANIDAGGFGRVDKMELADGTFVAKKTFQPADPTITLRELEKLRERFKREVKYQSLIHSNAICPILDSDLDADQPWFTMPFAEKTLLIELIESKRTGRIPTQAFADILNGLEKIHDLGYVHRDLKPQNILYLDGEWKLSDFGLLLPPSGITTRLTSSSAYGTEGYSAPEQAIHFHDVTSQADIYSFGCILHDFYFNQRRIPYSTLQSPGPIGRIIEICTDQDPRKRFLSINELRSTLNRFLARRRRSSTSRTAKDWIVSLDKVETITKDQFENLVQYLRFDSDSDDKFAVFEVLNSNMIVSLHQLDLDSWNLMAQIYFAWTSNRGFEFSFCDSLAQRLFQFYKLGKINIQSNAVISTASMAASHNRWYAMEKVLLMCKHDIEDSLAERISIDIEALDLKDDFRKCTRRLNQSIDSYHPYIKNVLT